MTHILHNPLIQPGLQTLLCDLNIIQENESNVFQIHSPKNSFGNTLGPRVNLAEKERVKTLSGFYFDSKDTAKM